MDKLGSEWKREILSRSSKLNKELSSKDMFVKEYVSKMKKKQEDKEKSKKKYTYKRQSNVDFRKRVMIRKSLGPEPIRLR